MRELELSNRIDELDTGKRDPEWRASLALKLHKEGYAPVAITCELKRKFGKGVPLTIFSKEPSVSKSSKSKTSADKAVQAKISRRITAKASELVTKYLRTGERVEENLSPIASQYGYEDTADFIIERLYPFFDLYYNHVQKLEEENRNFQSGMQRLMERLGPEARRQLFLTEAGQFIQSTALIGHLTGHPMPPNVLQGYIKVLWETHYEDTSAMLKDPTFWIKKFYQKAAGK